MLFWFCVFLSLKAWKHFCLSSISFLKLCANWVHVNLRIVNRFSFVSLTVHVCCFKNLLLEKIKNWTTLMGIKKPINNDQSNTVNINMQRTTLCWIENDNGWFYASGKCVVLCEYVLHICHEYTKNDIHNGKKKSRRCFLVSTRVFKNIDCYWLKGSNLVRFCIIDNLINCNVPKLTKH
jgi:hypothetical protein